MLVTIPFGSSPDKMQGFISVMGDDRGDNVPCMPILTFCIEKPTGGAIASTIVFPDQGVYLDFIDKIHLDAYSNFSGSKDLFSN